MKKSTRRQFLTTAANLAVGAGVASTLSLGPGPTAVAEKAAPPTGEIEITASTQPWEIRAARERFDLYKKYAGGLITKEDYYKEYVGHDVPRVPGRHH